MEYKILKLRDYPFIKEKSAQWFHNKWGIPLADYNESMDQCLKAENYVPQWYIVVKDNEIIGGAGVIENDFHDRKELTPNICAVYVEEHCRNKGIAGKLLNFICEDFNCNGIDTLYLLTDHTGFYERYDWQFFCMAQGDGEDTMSRMYIHKI